MNRIRINIVLVFIFVVVYLQNTVAQQIDVLPITCSNNLPLDSVLIFHDKTGTATYNEVSDSANKAKFVAFETLGNSLKKGETYWLRIHFRNVFSQTQELILEFFNYHIQEYTIYDPGSDTVLVQKTGVSILPQYRKLNKGQEPAAPIFISQPGEDIYIKLERIKASNFEMDLKVSKPELYHSRIFWKNFGGGVFQGLIWMLILVNIFMNIQQIDRTRKYYVLFMLFISLFFLNHSQYLIHIGAFFVRAVPYLYLSVFPALMFYVLFIKRFINLDTLFPVINKILNIYSLFSFFLFVLASVFMFTEFELYETISSFYYISVLVAGGIVIYYSTKIKTRVTKFFRMGIIGFLLGSALTIFGQIGIFSYSMAGFEAGLVFQFFVFTFGIAVKQEEERKSAEQKIIEQLRENQQLQTKVNRELEEKVRERTAEISAKNEEITAQSESLKAANHEILLSNEQLNQKNRQITDSINYAARIQQAILGNIEAVEQKFEQAFIFFKPHSIVSGDFYWYAETNHKKIMVIADCTGHGVPGAFMTVLGNGYLDEIINMAQVSDPSEILYKLDQKITNNLRKTESGEGNVSDGMDMCVLTFDKKTGNVCFAGAKNPLLHVSNGNMTVIKGSKFAIGGAKPKKGNEKEFEMHQITPTKGDTFYVYSDGFQDQFGGQYGRKYLSRRFKELLLEISEKPISQQKQMLENELSQWKGDYEQTDDILVAGIVY